MLGNILLVDDDDGVLRAITRLLRRSGYQVKPFIDAAAALQSCDKHRYDVVISDYRMPGMNGVEFLNALRDVHPLIVRIILSGEADRDAVLASINESAVYRFLTKPWDDAVLIDTVSDAVSQGQVNRETEDALDHRRRQVDHAYRRARMLDDLEKQSPGITSVNWSENDTIVIDETGL
jgi:DNA-binding NtrC family response regulator